MQWCPVADTSIGLSVPNIWKVRVLQCSGFGKSGDPDAVTRSVSLRTGGTSIWERLTASQSLTSLQPQALVLGWTWQDGWSRLTLGELRVWAEQSVGCHWPRAKWDWHGLTHCDHNRVPGGREDIRVIVPPVVLLQLLGEELSGQLKCTDRWKCKGYCQHLFQIFPKRPSVNDGRSLFFWVCSFYFGKLQRRNMWKAIGWAISM